MNLDLKIYLYDILINGQSSSDLEGLLDIDVKDFDDFGLEFNYNIEDISDSGTRKSSYSKSFNLPDTPRNNVIFKNVSNANISTGSFDPNKKQKCIISVNNKILVKGYLILRSIKQVYVAGKLTKYYNVNINDQVIDLFNDIGNKYLSDLDFKQGFSFMGTNYSFSDHYYNGNSVITSQERTKSHTNVYDYCLTNFNTQGVSSGENYPPKSIQSSVYHLPLDQFFPNIYVKALVDKIFGEAGYTYDSKFFDGLTYDGIFLKLATIYNRGKMFSDYTKYYKVSNLNQSPGSNLYNGTEPDENFYYNRIQYDLVYQTDDVDKGAYVSEFNIVGSGTYRFNIEMIKVTDTSTVGDYSSTFVLVDDGNNILYEKPLYEMLNDDFSLNTGENTSAFSITLELEKGQVLEPMIKIGFIDNDPTYNGADFVIDDFFMALDIYHTETEDRINDIVSITEFLPIISQGDFIKGLITQFNLYIYPSKLDPRKLIIEPRPDFYNDGQIYDWTNKVDRSKIDIKPTSKKIKKDYEFNQTDIDSVKSREYFNNNSNYIGNEHINYTDTNLSGTDTTTSIFGRYDVNVDVDTADTMYIPNLVNTTFDSLTTAKRELAMMIGIVDNVDTSPKDIRVLNAQDNIVTNWNTISNIGIVGDNKYDINFSSYKQVEGEDTLSTYELFWADAISNLHNINQRLITMYINLDIIDILKIDFRNKIMIDGVVYILQRVVVDLAKKTQSKVELIKAYDIELNIYDDTVNFFYSNTIVGDIPTGTGKPILDNSIFATDRYIKKINVDDLFIEYLPKCASNEYTWFAIPTSMDRSTASKWEVTYNNKGNIGGTVNLFGDLQSMTYDGQDYNVYQANYQTFIDDTLKITLNLIFSDPIFDYKFGSTGDEPGQFKTPMRMAIANNLLYVIDSYKQAWYDPTYVAPVACQVFDLAGNFVTEFGYRWAAPYDPPYDNVGDGEFDSPESIAVNSTNIYIADGHRYDIQILDLDGNFISSFSSKGQNPGEILSPIDMCVNSNFLYVVADTRYIMKFDLLGNFISRIGGNGTADGQFNSIDSLACDDNYLYAGDTALSRVQCFDLNDSDVFCGKFGSSGTTDGEFGYVNGLTIDNNYIHVADRELNRVTTFDRLTLQYVGKFGTTGTADGEFENCKDVIAHDNKLRVIDSIRDDIQVFTY